MFKRVGLFLAMNLAVIVLVTIVIAIIENVFSINVSGYGGGYTGLLIFSALFGFIGSFISLFMSKWMAKKAYNMTFITYENSSEINDKQRIVWDTVVDLSERNNINIPEVGIYHDDEPNAFATGASKNNSLVAVSTGLLDSMDKPAIEGVVAHEMAHILNGDMVTMTLLQGVLNTFVIFFARIAANIVQSAITKGEDRGNGFIYYGIVMLFEILFGLLASIIAMWFSRHREFRADEGSARFVGKEKMIAGLIALKKMQPVIVSNDDNLSSMKISSRKKQGFKSLFSSHPDLDDRIERLENLIIN